MSKITCEVCGTVFPDTASNCPICGWSPTGAEPKAEANMGDFDVNTPREPKMGGAQQGRRIFDFDEANGRKSVSTEAEDDDTSYYGSGNPGMGEPPRKTNTALVVVLVIFIVLVLIATGVLVVKFLLPGKKADTKATTAPTIVAETVETAPTEEVTEETTVPCTSLYAPTVSTLTKEGELWKLNVKASPEDTTDEITYTSEDESVVTVSAEGNVTAVGNGTTNIVVTCGDQTVKCPVTVAIEETEPTTEATEATEAAEADATEETKSSSSGDVTLKLKRSDITFSRLGVYYTLQLDCDLDASDVTWRTSNSAIANVNNGVVTAMGPGIAKITAKYGDQEVSCIVRCKF